MLILQDISYAHPNKEVLFDNLHLTVSGNDIIALVGNNGTGKSTLLQLIAGVLQPLKGTVTCSTPPYYVPQLFGQYNQLTVAQALRIDTPLNALHEILAGNVTETNLALLNDDWTLEERCLEALAAWELENISLDQPMHTLSGGQKTKVFLAGIAVHQPEIVLLDEPSNHLDTAGRELLYHFISSFTGTMLVVSHDRQLLQLPDSIYELSKQGIKVYGGNYDFYTEQKEIENNAFNQDVKSKEKALRKARETERETMERQQKLDARGKKKQEKAGLPTILMNTLRNSAEKSTARTKEVHAEKTGAIAKELQELRNAMPDLDKMKFGFDDSLLHSGKILITARDLNHAFQQQWLWKQPLSFEITSGERIALRGRNGSGKTTLIQLMLGQLLPVAGTLNSAVTRAVYIDQEYSLINNQLTVYEQAQQFNAHALQEHEIKIRLTRFLFMRDWWDKPCSVLSGGEKMRLMLCCLTLGQQAPDLIILDEPTNNLDIQNVAILTAAINGYKGTMLVVSHDTVFLKQVNVQRTITL